MSLDLIFQNYSTEPVVEEMTAKSSELQNFEICKPSLSSNPSLANPIANNQDETVLSSDLTRAKVTPAPNLTARRRLVRCRPTLSGGAATSKIDIPDLVQTQKPLLKNVGLVNSLQF